MIFYVIFVCLWLREVKMGLVFFYIMLLKGK